MNGLRALVTRPRAEAVELAAALERRGIAALIEPLIEIRFADLPPPDLAGVRAILCTSANGVRALARLTPARGLPLFAVGDATAARAREAGFAAVTVDLALFFSPRSSAIFVRRIEAAGLAASLGRVAAVSISAAADRPLAAFAWHARHIAARPNQEALLAALDTMLAPSP